MGLHVTQVKRYESGANQPSLKVLKRIAVTFGVTTDFLLFDEAERQPGEELMLQFEAINQLPPEEQAIVREVLESLIIKYQTRRWDSSRSGTKAAAPAKKAPATKRAAHATAR